MGGDIGATILYKIGRDGTLWGDPGFNETTSESLWPFPQEDLIKEQMSQYYYDNVSDGLGPLRGDRGFCADGTGLYGGPITLTSYIWEYLGNPCPNDICDYGISPTETCSDGIQNQDETGIDCGGVCPPCPTQTNYNLTHFIQLISDWLKSEPDLTSDVNNDGTVNTRDLGIMMSNWQN